MKLDTNWKYKNIEFYLTSPRLISWLEQKERLEKTCNGFMTDARFLI